MTDEQKPSAANIGEIALTHSISAALVTLFFRWQASEDNYWQAGDESLIANGVAAVLDIVYWLVKPRVVKWRNG